MTKAYCIDCKYMKYESYDCTYPDNMREIYSAFERKIESNEYYTKINANNNCNWFEPKWYKKRKYK